MRLLLTIVVLGTLSTACNKARKPEVLSSDAKLSQMIVGSWATQNGVIKIDADGSSTSTFTNSKSQMLLYQTDWKITNGYIVITVNNIVTSRDNTNHESIGSVDRVKIVSLDSTNLVWQSEKGFDLSMIRLK